jgi:serine/threonine-protein kinase
MGGGASAVERYELHDELASGGMASVHLGRSLGDAGFTKSVAIKRMHANAAARNPEARTQLLQEARLTERIRHPNVVATLDVVDTDEELWLVMEYVHGVTLAQLLLSAAKRGERCAPAIAASILHDVLIGLGAAHRTVDAAGRPLGILHRDISPQNILVGADGLARLLDFGIAKVIGGEVHTSTGIIKGKAPYIAPEILGGALADRRTDLYAAAVVLWEALTGHPLFQGDNAANTLGNVLTMRVPRPSETCGPLGGIEEVVMRGLSRNPNERFSSAEEMAEALERAGRLAPATEVAVWVERCAGDTLARLAAKLRTVEAAPPRASSGSPLARSGPADPQGRSAAQWQPDKRGRRRTRDIWLVLAAGLVIAAGFAVRARAKAKPHDADEGVPTKPSAALDPTPATSGETPAPGDVSAGTKVAPPPPGRVPAPHTFAAPFHGSTTSHGRSGGCDPPYSLDADGKKHFKLSCVH